jgi:pyruvate kinase
MGMLWGVHPIKCPKLATAEQMVDHAEAILEQGGFVRPKEILGIVAGTRTRSGSTNFLRLHVLGDRLTDALDHRGEKSAKSRKPTRKSYSRKPTKVSS